MDQNINNIFLGLRVIPETKQWGEGGGLFQKQNNGGGVEGYSRNKTMGEGGGWRVIPETKQWGGVEGYSRNKTIGREGGIVGVLLLT